MTDDSAEKIKKTTIGIDSETTDAKNKNAIEQIKIKAEVHLKTAISQLRQCEVGTDPDTREKLDFEQKELAQHEHHLSSTLKAEKELVIQSKVTITALNKKLYDLKVRQSQKS